MESALAAAAAISDQKQKIEQYKLILSSIVSSAASDAHQAKRLIDHLVSYDVALFVSRRVLLILAQEIFALTHDAQKEIAHYALAQVQPRAVSFEDQVLAFREKLVELYESEKQWSKAAQMLGIDMDSGIRKWRSRCQIADPIPSVALCLNDDDEEVSSRKEKKEDIGGEGACCKGLPCMNRLREELSCTICLEICYEPSTTPCGHSFCKKCLKCAVDKCGKRCPKCRQLISNWRSCTLNTVLWNTIQLLFPEEMEARKKVILRTYSRKEQKLNK